ncbi:AAA family ATPase [Vibrio rotiferianus]|uniref:AAA family ATPase n=1 Tax=Vibrio rotiferianus TaxID=190895 RepID=UPI0024931834|nr:AAA family ATPase [Vibrio rotiferianus]
METSKRTLEEAIEDLEHQEYYPRDYHHFVDIGGREYPAKRLYAAIQNIDNDQCHTSDAERYFKNSGYKLINRNPLSVLPDIWKVSHGFNEISQEASSWLDEHCYITVHRETAKNQGKKFIQELKVGDIVSLYRSGYVKSLVRVTSNVVVNESSPLGEDWPLRKYELIKALPDLVKYTGINKGWSPSYNSTLSRVYKQKPELSLFEENILQPFYSMKLDDFFAFSVTENTLGEDSMNYSASQSPLNQILYGPPGTGKTYHTIEAAVQAAEPDFYASLDIDAEVGVTETQRDSLTQKYQSLTDAGRIRFVTFHQSYGYEEFVEGLSAKTEGGQISYYEKDGVFKALCEEAKGHQETKTTDEKNDFDTLWVRFLDGLSELEGGIRVDTVRTFFTVTDVDNNTIRFEKDKGESTHSLSVKTLKAIFNGERVINGGLNPYYSALIKHLEQLARSKSEVKTERQNYVLVIDEINRGNISKIFGELITLIESSKRKGAKEQLEVTLPYSGDKFSVPDNLYIIGTMNTADRSLAMMDTALRRRFDFKEMMPKPKVFADKQVKGINLSRLLETLNKRIEVLYDREHTLGHAFLFPVFNEADEDKAFFELQSAFKNKIMPLLEEYFYEDWSKIRLVLGDSLKQSESLRFLQKTEDTYTDLFGPDHGLDLYEDSKVTYSIKPFRKGSVWDNPQAYKAIYAQESE